MTMRATFRTSFAVTVVEAFVTVVPRAADRLAGMGCWGEGSVVPRVAELTRGRRVATSPSIRMMSPAVGTGGDAIAFVDRFNVREVEVEGIPVPGTVRT